jgi:hypothetical protein
MEKKRIILIVFLSLILILRLLSSIAAKDYDFFWFCVVNMTLLVFAIGFNNILLFSSILVSSLIVEFFRTLDLFSYLLTGELPFNVANYIFGMSQLNYILSYYHIFLIMIPAYYLLKEQRFHKYAWLLSSALFLISSLLSLALTDTNANCARDYCNLGVFNALYSFRPEAMPFVLFHWLFATLLVFLPSHFIIKYTIEKTRSHMVH